MSSHSYNQDRADEIESAEEADSRRFNRFLVMVAVAAFVALFLLTALACTPESDYQKEQQDTTIKAR